MMLARIITELDERILNDQTLTQPFLAELIAAQHELGLVFDNRPTCPFLRPHIIARSRYDQVVQAAGIVALAMEKVVNRALQDEELLSVFGLTEREQRMATIDPGYERLCITSRLDSYVSDTGFQFLEYNAETPAGVGDQMQLEKTLWRVQPVKELLTRHRYWWPEPHRRLLQALREAYREWGGDSEHPHLAIVDWKGVATESEFRILQEYFVSEGHETVIADPRELRYDGQNLFASDFRIDLVYKRVVIHEFLERCGDDHPLARAYADRRICVVNSFRSKIAHKKAGFAVLSDPQYEHFFTGEEIDVLRQSIPWTRRVLRGTTTFHGAAADLIDLIRREQNRLVLKPNDDYGGHGVFIGWELTAREWEQAIAQALKRPYVAQERVPLKKIPMPTFGDGVRLTELFVDFNPFLFHNEAEGALIRLSSSSLLNVTAGGGQTALLVLEDM